MDRFVDQQLGEIGPMVSAFGDTALTGWGQFSLPGVAGGRHTPRIYPGEAGRAPPDGPSAFFKRLFLKRFSNAGTHLA